MKTQSSGLDDVGLAEAGGRGLHGPHPPRSPAALRKPHGRAELGTEGAEQAGPLTTVETKNTAKISFLEIWSSSRSISPDLIKNSRSFWLRKSFGARLLRRPVY